MDATLEALLKILPLERLPRTGWIQGGVPAPETIAGHVVGVAHLAMALAPRVCPPLDWGKVVALCVIHDTPEALLGDIPRSASALLPAGAKRAAEASAAEELLGPLHENALGAFQEFAAQDTREARLARVCDGLQLGVRLLAYLRAGQRGLDGFIETVRAIDTSEFPPATEFKGILLGAIEENAQAAFLP